jgi:DNA-binding NtrC family response regulator
MNRFRKETRTMDKVLIVDDESIIRKGLKNIIDWKELGLRGMREAATCMGRHHNKGAASPYSHN